MEKWSFNRELYSKVALIKAAYSFSDIAYIHLDADEKYYYVEITKKEGTVTYNEFVNEMLAQSVRHEVYKQTKNIRELLLARAMATSVVLDGQETSYDQDDEFSENEIVKDWFSNND